MSEIYGFSSVVVTKQQSELQWLISNTVGVPLCAAKWIWLFQPNMINTSNYKVERSINQSILAGMAIEPLTTEEIESVFKAYPNILKKDISAVWLSMYNPWSTPEVTKKKKNILHHFNDDDDLTPEERRVVDRLVSKMRSKKKAAIKDRSYTRKIH